MFPQALGYTESIATIIFGILAISWVANKNWCCRVLQKGLCSFSAQLKLCLFPLGPSEGSLLAAGLPSRKASISSAFWQLRIVSFPSQVVPQHFTSLEDSRNHSDPQLQLIDFLPLGPEISSNSTQLRAAERSGAPQPALLGQTSVSGTVISWNNTTIRKCHLRIRVHKIAKRQAEDREAIDVQNTSSDQHTAQPLQKKRQNQCTASREHVAFDHRCHPALYVTTCHSSILQPVPRSLTGSSLQSD